MDEWLPSPALVLDRMWKILELNHATQVVFGLSEADENLLASLVTNPTVRSRFPDYDQMIQTAIAQFRASTADHCDDPYFRRLVDELCERDPKFAAFWCNCHVVGPDGRHKTVNHPIAGVLTFETQIWRPASSADSIQLVIHIPQHLSRSRHKLQKLLSRECLN